MNARALAVVCKASELEETLQQSIDAIESGELATTRGRLVRFHDLPNDEQLTAAHAQLARLIREGRPKPEAGNDEG
jgi:hypothetical protein